MAGIHPPGHGIREAVRWISERRLENPNLKLLDLVSEASRRFNLTAKQELELLAFLKAGEPTQGARERD